MLKHLVFFKFKPATTTEQIDELAERLGNLPPVIDEIKEFVFGRDFVRSERSWDFALVSLFDDMEAMQRYQAHPDHQQALAHIKQICSDIAAVDFTC